MKPDSSYTWKVCYLHTCVEWNRICTHVIRLIYKNLWIGNKRISTEKEISNLWFIPVWEISNNSMCVCRFCLGMCKQASGFREEGRRDSLWVKRTHAQSTLCLFHVNSRFSGLSLALQKGVCDWLRQTLNPSELKVSDPSKTELIHTSCRSESSNISLVVLDNE